MDENRYNNMVRQAISDEFKRCSKDKHDGECRIFEITNKLLKKGHELSYTEAEMLIGELDWLERKVERLRIELDVWDRARELCLNMADEMCKE